MKIQAVNNYTYSSKAKSNSHPSFKSDYEVDTSTAYTRGQVLTLGMLMSNFWVSNARYTFQQMKNTGVYSPITMHVKDMRDNIFEKIMKNNNISFKKIDTGVKYY